MENRVIFHIDMDAFFASIEILKNPQLKGKPVVVGGKPEKRGVVSTCSYEARKFGIHSAMSLSEAKKRCPHAIFLEGSFSLYGEFSERIMEIFRTLTHQVQVVSIDEAYIDVSDIVDQYQSALELAQLLKQEVYNQTKLTCSIGIATNKQIAKMASGTAKPNGIREVHKGQEKEFLAPLPIQHLPGVGAKTQAILNQQGIKTIGDLQKMEMDTLIDRYGSHGYYLFLASQGKDNRPVAWMERPPKSIGAEMTFEKDHSDFSFLASSLEKLVLKAWRRLKESKMRTSSICLKLRDSQFNTVTRAKMLFADTNHLQTLQRECVALLKEVYTGAHPLRLLGVSFRKLTEHYWQPTLWDWESK